MNPCDQGPWRRREGSCTDQDVILRIREVLTDHLGGIAEDILPGDGAVPEPIAGAVTTGYKHGAWRPCVFLRADLTTTLRADLWGFCTALALQLLDGQAHGCGAGIVGVGRERRPVKGYGTGLLGALIVRRFGRRPAACDFPIFVWPATESSPVRRAA
ncbi:hypothetical protein [Streptomyces sp. 769]|uniref:hypothetical protein n=1 Tax=Streptomyces sp. 769 TaxID=1262452 RepID=UPI000581FD5F|nr:hypothetical protein [Streptomyces sp. 769]AJC53651.1 hypothetical protein GZL_01047 [Streptomyces sp. 769]